MKILKAVLMAGVIGSPFPVSHAHHSYSGVFDMSSVTQFEARVVKLELRNPHTIVHVEVVNEQGDVELWTIEGPGKLALVRRGWADDMFAAGELITVYGNPSAQGKAIVWLSKIIKADGVELLDPLTDDDLAIEEERRARLSRARQDK